MTQFFSMIADFWSQIFDKLNTVGFEVNGYTASYGDLLLALLFVGIIITVFWRGAKT